MCTIYQSASKIYWEKENTIKNMSRTKNNRKIQNQIQKNMFRNTLELQGPRKVEEQQKDQNVYDLYFKVLFSFFLIQPSIVISKD